jgi:glycosyltransferase involved in cell wall biosynthesis
MPAFNAAETIKRAIQSVLIQSFESWELIIVNDGSTDETSSIIRRFSDERIKLIELPTNKGRGIARIESLRLARGEFITMLDADDWMYPERLEIQYLALSKSPNIAIHSVGLGIVDDSDNLVGVRGRQGIFNVGQYDNFPGAHAASMIRRSAIGNNSYKSWLKYGQDQDFLFRVSLQKNVQLTDQVAYVYTEVESFSLKKLIRMHFYFALSHFSNIYYRGIFGSLLMGGKELLKIPLAVIILGLLGKRKYLARRSRIPSVKQTKSHQIALKRLR